MKHSFITKFISIIIGAIIFAPNYAFASNNIHPELKVIIAKFSIAMIGVALFSILIYFGLSLYNKFFVSDNIKDVSKKDISLSSPRDKNEAILNFIYKNRLK